VPPHQICVYTNLFEVTVKESPEKWHYRNSQVWSQTIREILTLVVYSRDNEAVGADHEVNSPKNEPQFLMTMGQVQTNFQIDPKWLQQVATGFQKKIYLIKFSTDWLTACLPACFQTSITWGYVLDFFTVRRHFGVRGALWHTAVCTMHSSWTSFVFHSSLLTAKSVDSVVAHDGFLLVTENFLYFSYWLPWWHSWSHSCFSNTSRLAMGWTQLAMKHNGCFAFLMIIDIFECTMS